MIIELASLGKSPKAIEAEFSPEDIELGEVKLAESANFRGQICKYDRKTHLAGHISTKLATDCVRCLEPVNVPVEIDFEDVFVDVSDEPKQDELEVAAGDLDESLVIGGSIDLAEVTREQIILATDEPVLCREDCKGLCPKCGQNQNLIDCKCEQNEIDPRWAALKNLN